MNWLKLIFLKVIFVAIFLSSNVFAGGLEVSRQNNMILFSKDKTVNFSSRQTSSNVTDDLYTASDNQSIIKQLNIMSAAFKSNYNENISYAFEMYEPFASTLKYASGVKAMLRSQALGITGKYNFTNSQFGIIAGTKYLTFKRSTLNLGAGDMTTTPDSGFSYMAGISYEIPEIALKVLLTHSPGIDITVPTTVVGSGTLSQPDMTTLDFETGIANNTLLFGSAHQVAHSSAQVKLKGIGAISSFTDSDKYQIGLGRKFSEQWSASLSYTTEAGGAATGTSLLSPTSGTDTYGLGVKYSSDTVDFSFGYGLSSFGDKAVTTGAGTGNFKNNDATTLGLKLAFKLQ
jgi:long-subunit fatty acid transport protein